MPLRSLIFWLGFVLCLPLALYLKYGATRSVAAKGARAGKAASASIHASAKIDLALLCIGDSIIDGVGTRDLSVAVPGQAAKALANRFRRPVKWRAIAQSGLKAAEVSDLFQKELQEGLRLAADERYDYVLLSVGVNNVTGLHSVKRFQSELHTLLSCVRSAVPCAEVMLIGLPPMDKFPRLPQPLRALFGLRARQFDEVAKQVAGHIDGCVHVALTLPTESGSFAEDGYHPSEQACEQLGRLLAGRFRAPEEG